ncbi:MAG TPA: FGGY family carbohydrate kinase [Bauldia sp.]|nr:FGGY family carbohydrate kinase [Bauldia sp.]
MERVPAVAVLDIGKSNVKLALVDLDTRKALAVRTTGNAVLRDGPYPHYDVERIWAFLLDGLSAFRAGAEIVAISTTTHGAAFALLAGDELALPVLDYEHDGPEAVRVDYTMDRGAFSETLSPDLPNGLNAGRQLYWQARVFPEAWARTDTILPYPQYWVWRLTGERVAEATSLGCHTDMWNPRVGTYSRLASSEGWVERFPRLAKPWEVVGRIRPEIAEATGLSPTCRVLAGIHDSNASLYPHIVARKPPFAVLSSGTWMVVFAPGGSIEKLDASRDCLANVDALGRAVPSARFMAGREFAELAGQAAEPGAADIERVIAERIMALPSFARGTGPFGRRTGNWTQDPAGLAPGMRTAAASLYAALVTDTCLGLAGADGASIVEGPFARNGLFLGALASLTGRAVIGRPDATGTTDGAALLALGPAARPDDEADGPPTPPLEVDLAGYAAEWRRRAAARSPSPA